MNLVKKVLPHLNSESVMFLDTFNGDIKEEIEQIAKYIRF